MHRPLLIILILNTILSAEVPIVPGRLSVDGLLWCYGTFSRGGARGWFKNAFEFRHRQATVGLTGKIAPLVSSRLEFDFSRLTLRDLAVEFTWHNGIGLKVGQMLLPLSFNSEISEEQLNLEEYSLLCYTNILKPENPRDIGVVCWYRSDSTDASAIRAIAGVVNGTGPNTGDNNNAKDIFVRLVLKPWHTSSLTLGTRIYYGWTQTEAVPWLGLGAELQLNQGPFLISPEIALRRHQNVNVLAGDMKIEARFNPVVPALSFEIIRWEDAKIQWRVLPGINILPHDRLKILIGFQYHSLTDIWEYQALVIKLQAAL